MDLGIDFSSKESFFYNFVNLIKSLFQYFSDLIAYFSGGGDVPEVEPVGD